MKTVIRNGKKVSYLSVSNDYVVNHVPENYVLDFCNKICSKATFKNLLNITDLKEHLEKTDIGMVGHKF